MNKIERLKDAKRVLIVVDMINGFMKEGVLADPKTMHIVPAAVKIIEEFINNNYPVIAFRDVHNEDSPEHNNFKALLPKKHCLAGTAEVELIDELKKYEEKMFILDKNATMGMIAPFVNYQEYYANLWEYLVSLRQLVEVVLIGVCTDICVMDNAIPIKKTFDQVNREIEVTVPKNAVDTYHVEGVHDKDEWNNMAFRFMNQAGIYLPEEYTLKGRK